MLDFLFKCGAHARYPLLDRRVNPTFTKNCKAPCDLMWLYGDHDWMNSVNGERSSDFISQHTAYNSSV